MDTSLPLEGSGFETSTWWSVEARDTFGEWESTETHPVDLEDAMEEYEYLAGLGDRVRVVQVEVTKVTKVLALHEPPRVRSAP